MGAITEKSVALESLSRFPFDSWENVVNGRKPQRSATTGGKSHDGAEFPYPNLD